MTRRQTAHPTSAAPRRWALPAWGRGFWIVMGAALLVRLAAVLWLRDTIPYSDYFYYHEAGRMQAEDPGFFFRHETVVRFGKLNWWPPGYPMFLAALYTIAGPDFRVAVFLQVLLGVATCMLVYAIGERIGGRRVALGAAGLVALDPTFIFTTNLIASENLFAPLLALGLWGVGHAAALWTAPAARADGARRAMRGAILRRAIPVGIVLALATLVRAIGLCLPWIAAVWLYRSAPRPLWGRTAALGVLGGFFLTLAPWTARNAVVAGSPALVCFGGGLNFYFGHNPGPLGYRELGSSPLAGLKDAARIDRRGYQEGLAFIARDPLGVLTRAASKVVALFAPPTYALHANSAILLPDPSANPELAGEAAALRARQQRKDAALHGPLAVLAAVHSYLLLLAALLALVRRVPQHMPEMRFLTAVVVVWIGAHALFWAQPRFRYPLDIPMALLAAAAFAAVAQDPDSGHRRRRVTIAP